MAITKKRKNEVIDLYKKWASDSQALFLAEYTGLTMKDIDDLRNKVREAGGEFHVVKNTLGKRAFEAEGFPIPEGFFEGSTAISFAFKDPPVLAKIMADFARANESLKIKGGYLDKEPIRAESVQSLADLPPLAVMQARFLGLLITPASQLVRTLAEPARQLASVLQAYVDKNAPAPAS
ncbi:MAG: 50S ribosomal protein L10 [Anaerolineales bacterium]|nr:50S ribosomal protein L10 [Anaerolineales bacterium]